MPFQEDSHKIWSRGVLIAKDTVSLADLFEIYEYLGGAGGGGGGGTPDPPPEPIATVDVDLDNDGDADVRVTVDDIPEDEDDE